MRVLGRGWLVLLVGVAGCRKASVPEPHVDAASSQAQFVSRVPPVYPAEARAAKVEGQVVLHEIIGKDGHVQTVDVISGPPMLQEAAIKAVSQWVYQPYLENGKAVEVSTTATLNFRLKH